MAATADREKALATALQQIEKQHGKGSIMRLGEQETVKIAAIPTGSVALDVALGVGGLPRGRIVEIYVPNPPARRRWLCTQSLMPRLKAASVPLLTPSTLSTRNTHANSGSIQIPCW